MLYTVGSVDRHYRPTYQPTLGRCMGRVSADIWSTLGRYLTVGQVSAEYLSSISQVLIEYRAICQPLLDQDLTTTQSISYF